MTDTTSKSIRGIGIRQDGESTLAVIISGEDGLGLASHLTAQIVAGRYFRHVNAEVSKFGKDSWEVVFRLTPKTSIDAFERLVLDTAAAWYGNNAMPLIRGQQRRHRTLL